MLRERVTQINRASNMSAGRSVSNFMQIKLIECDMCGDCYFHSLFIL